MESKGESQQRARSRSPTEEGEKKKTSNNETVPVIRNAEQEDGPYAKMISHEQETPIIIHPAASVNGKEEVPDKRKVTVTDEDEDDDPYMHMIAHDDPGERKELEKARDMRQEQPLKKPVVVEEENEDGPYARMMAHEDLRAQVNENLRSQVRRLSATDDVEPQMKKARTVIQNAQQEDGPYATMLSHEDHSAEVISVKDKSKSNTKEEESKPKKVIRNAEQEDGPYATLIAGHEDNPSQS